MKYKKTYTLNNNNLSNIKGLGLTQDDLKQYVNSTLEPNCYYLYSDKKRLLEYKGKLSKFRNYIKESMTSPNENIKLWIVEYSYDLKHSKYPIKILIGQYTLTPKLALMKKDGDKVQTILYSEDELKTYGFNDKIIFDLINAFKNNKISFATMSVSISSILQNNIKIKDDNNNIMSLITKQILNQIKDFDDVIQDELNLNVIANLLIHKDKLEAEGVDIGKEINKVIKMTKKYYNNEDIYNHLFETLEDISHHIAKKNSKELTEYYLDFKNMVGHKLPKKEVIIVEEPKMLLKKKPKKETKPKVEKPEKTKKEKILKIWYRLPPVPEGHRLASMKEAMDANKIYYWGHSKVDSKLLENKLPKISKNELIIKMAGLKGKLTRVKREIDVAKTQAEKTKLMQDFETTKEELMKVVEQFNKK